MTERQNQDSSTAEMQGYPDPATDWADQRELAALLGISEKTACCWAKEGRLAEFEHGVPQSGRKKYSRALIQRGLQHCWRIATRRQDENYS